MMSNLVMQLDQIFDKDLTNVGSTNALLGEIIRQLSRYEIRVPDGFVTTADAYWDFIQRDGLYYEINELLENVDKTNIRSLQETGRYIRSRVLKQPINTELENALFQAYWDLSKGIRDVPVAVCSSLVGEKLQDRVYTHKPHSYLNIRGEQNFIHAFRTVIASLFDDEAIRFRADSGFCNREVALSVGVQKMVPSEHSISGKILTFGTQPNCKDTVLITSSYGLRGGDQDLVCPDEFTVYKHEFLNDTGKIIKRTLGTKAIKIVYGDIGRVGASLAKVEVSQAERNCFSVSDNELCLLASHAQRIEQLYGGSMVINWVKDSNTNYLYIVQAHSSI